MNRMCVRCRAPFEVDAQQRAFLLKIRPTIGGQVYDIPLPTHCPECRLQRRFAFRNQIYVGQVRSASTQNALFSMFPTPPPFPVLPNAEWWDEVGWSPEDYGRVFDFSRPFFEQMRELMRVVPKPALNVLSPENSQYCNNVGSIKNCYFVFDAGACEDCYYVETAEGLRSCVDCSMMVGCELCYDCTGCTRCYNLQSSTHCTDCQDSYFLLDCRSCRNCFGCSGLRQSEFCIFNKPYSREAYFAYLGGIQLDSYAERQRVAREGEQFQATQPRAHMVGSRIEDCTGNIVHSARRVRHGFSVSDAEDVAFGFALSGQVRDCQDYAIWGEGAELMYECCICGKNVFHQLFCLNCWEGAHDLMYCDSCHGSGHLFGCVGMRKREFCVLNRQYSEGEYHALVARIIEHMRQTGEWGEFFPMSISTVPYNYSLAQRYNPLDEGEARAEGLPWHEPPAPKTIQAMDAADLPDGIPPGEESLVVRSAKSGRPFKITVEELRRYRELNVPLPRVTYDERMDDRARRAGSPRLYKRQCAKSGVDILTVIPPSSPVEVWEKSVFDREHV